MNDPVRQARDVAIAAHGDQRYGTHPYVHHLDAVAAILEPFGTAAQIVGYLHDTIEAPASPANGSRPCSARISPAAWRS